MIQPIYNWRKHHLLADFTVLRLPFILAPAGRFIPPDSLKRQEPLHTRKRFLNLTGQSARLEDGAAPPFYPAWWPDDITHIIEILIRILCHKKRRAHIGTPESGYILFGLRKFQRRVAVKMYDRWCSKCPHYQTACYG